MEIDPNFCPCINQNKDFSNVFQQLCNEPHPLAPSLLTHFVPPVDGLRYTAQFQLDRLPGNFLRTCTSVDFDVAAKLMFSSIPLDAVLVTASPYLSRCREYDAEDQLLLVSRPMLDSTTIDDNGNAQVSVPISLVRQIQRVTLSIFKHWCLSGKYVPLKFTADFVRCLDRSTIALHSFYNVHFTDLRPQPSRVPSQQTPIVMVNDDDDERVITIKSMANDDQDEQQQQLDYNNEDFEDELVIRPTVAAVAAESMRPDTAVSTATNDSLAFSLRPRTAVSVGGRTAKFNAKISPTAASMSASSAHPQHQHQQQPARGWSTERSRSASRSSSVSRPVTSGGTRRQFPPVTLLSANDLGIQAEIWQLNETPAPKLASSSSASLSRNSSTHSELISHWRASVQHQSNSLNEAHLRIAQLEQQLAASLEKLEQSKSREQQHQQQLDNMRVQHDRSKLIEDRESEKRDKRNWSIRIRSGRVLEA